MEALVRRVLKREPLPAISKIVDLGNLVSIRHLVPIGAHAIDHLTTDMDLRLATGEESFEPFGADLCEHPNPGEIIFAEGQIVLTRRWTWRQSKQTLILPETTAVEFNIDALPPVTNAEIETIFGEIMSLMKTYCSGELRCGVLSRENPSLDLWNVGGGGCGNHPRQAGGRQEGDYCRRVNGQRRVWKRRRGRVAGIDWGGTGAGRENQAQQYGQDVGQSMHGVIVPNRATRNELTRRLPLLTRFLQFARILAQDACPLDVFFQVFDVTLFF
jgi:hypothetical protein